MSEYISRKEAYRLAKRICDAVDKTKRVLLGRVILDFIDDIPTADVRPVEWISVTERLPEDCTDVLAYIERNAWGVGDAPHRKREIAIGYHVNGLWHVDGCSKVDCISWQALPPPPKDGES